MPYTLKQRKFLTDKQMVPNDKTIPVYFEDNLQICDKSFKKTLEGYLQLDGIISRSGSQEYYAFEFGLTDVDPMSIIVVDRAVEEIVDPMSVASFINKPITDDHPISGIVNSSNFNQLAKGIILDVNPTEKGDKLKASLIIYDQALIESIENGKTELSAGYTAELEFSDGGKRAIQKKIRGNHVAFVDKARCGKECSILDTKPKTKEEITMKMKINGLEVDIADNIAPTVKQVVDTNEKLEKDITDANSKTDTVQAKLDVANEEIQTLKDAAIDETAITEMAEKLVSVHTDAKIIDSKYDCKGKTISEIQRDVVTKVMGDTAKDKSDAYIEARFDAMVDSSKEKGNDPLSKAFKDSDNYDVTDFDKARAEAVEQKRNAWKKKA